MAPLHTHPVFGDNVCNVSSSKQLAVLDSDETALGDAGRWVAKKQRKNDRKNFWLNWEKEVTVSSELIRLKDALSGRLFFNTQRPG